MLLAIGASWQDFSHDTAIKPNGKTTRQRKGSKNVIKHVFGSNASNIPGIPVVYFRWDLKTPTYSGKSK